MAILKLSTAYTRSFLMVLSSDHVSPATGKTVTVNLSKAGNAFGTAAGTVTEIANGVYKVALTAGDTNTSGDMWFNCTASGCDNTDFVDQVQSQIFTDLNLDGSGNIGVTSNVKKNVQLNGFTFLMTDATTSNPKTGLTVTATRSLNGGAYGACANAVTEISNGNYAITLAAADLNANVVALRFTATNANDLNIVLLTQP